MDLHYYAVAERAPLYVGSFDQPPSSLHVGYLVSWRTPVI